MWLLTAGVHHAFSQDCNSGYGGVMDYDYCVPSGSSCYSDQDYYDSCGPQYSSRSYGNYGYVDNGSYYDGDVYSSRRSRSYRNAERYDNNNSYQYDNSYRYADRGNDYSRPSYSASRRDVDSRLSYIEKVISYLVNMLGLNDEYGDSKKPIQQRAKRSGPSCAGGS